MPKRKRAADAKNNSASPSSLQTGATFSLMDGKIDVLEGLVMHKEAIGEEFENELISFVQNQCERGRRGELKKPTYLRTLGSRSQGNQREMIMYGGFFDFNRARPGKRGLVPPFPPILDRLVDHLISNNYLPNEVRPDSCIINQYDAGDCIPPHVDHKSYYRPISTLSLLGEEPMLVGTRFRTVRSSTWEPTCGKAIPLARRSLLVLGGNSGNISKHCISRCSGPRISITLRKQPPPDWKPDESELVGKKGDGQRQSHRGGGDGAEEGRDDEQQPKKKKALPGSAKRRKKMLHQTGGRNTGTIGDIGKAAGGNNGNSKKSKTNSETTNNTKKGKGNNNYDLDKKNASGKKSDKQARRNARRLEKKKAAGTSGV